VIDEDGGRLPADATRLFDASLVCQPSPQELLKKRMVAIVFVGAAGNIAGGEGVDGERIVEQACARRAADAGYGGCQLRGDERQIRRFQQQ